MTTGKELQCNSIWNWNCSDQNWFHFRLLIFVVLYNAKEPLCTKEPWMSAKEPLFICQTTSATFRANMRFSFIKSSPSSIRDIFDPLPQSPSLSVCLYLSVCVCLCLFPSVSDSISVRHCLCLCLPSISCLSLSLYHSLYIWRCRCCSLILLPSLSPSLPPHLALLWSQASFTGVSFSQLIGDNETDGRVRS